MAFTHNLLVIGAGAAGLGAAGAAATFGLDVALIDTKAKNFGGDCLNYGCVPSKTLLHIAHHFAGARSAKEFGLDVSGRADFAKVMAAVHTAIETIRRHENPDAFAREHGVETVVGRARFVDTHTVEVNGRHLSAPRIVLATGSHARPLTVPGAEQVDILDNEKLFWELKELPGRLLIVGGGPIGCEMAQAFQRLGSQVTIVDRGDRLLSKDPEPMSEILADRFREAGIQIFHRAEVKRFTDAHTAIIAREGAADFTLPFDRVLAAIGRIVRTEDMGLERAGVAVRDERIVVDEYYRTSQPHIYAIGDAAGREKFSHGAEMHNFDLYRNWLLAPFRKAHSLQHFSWVTYTDPQVATFGWTAEQLAEQSIDFETLDQPFTDDDRAIAGGYRDGHLRLYLSKPRWPWSSAKILGGSMIAPEAGELIQELLLMNVQGLPAKALTNKIYAYPVRSRPNQKVIRQWQQRNLSPRLLRLAGWWLRRRGMRK